MRFRMAAVSEGRVGGGSISATGSRTEIPPEALEQMKKFYGFDKPVHIRYLLWL